MFEPGDRLEPAGIEHAAAAALGEEQIEGAGDVAAFEPDAGAVQPAVLGPARDEEAEEGGADGARGGGGGRKCAVAEAAFGAGAAVGDEVKFGLCRGVVAGEGLEGGEG